MGDRDGKKESKRRFSHSAREEARKRGFRQAGTLIKKEKEQGWKQEGFFARKSSCSFF